MHSGCLFGSVGCVRLCFFVANVADDLRGRCGYGLQVFLVQVLVFLSFLSRPAANYFNDSSAGGDGVEGNMCRRAGASFCIVWFCICGAHLKNIYSDYFVRSVRCSHDLGRRGGHNSHDEKQGTRLSPPERTRRNVVEYPPASTRRPPNLKQTTTPTRRPQPEHVSTVSELHGNEWILPEDGVEELPLLAAAARASSGSSSTTPEQKWVSRLCGSMVLRSSSSSTSGADDVKLLVPRAKPLTRIVDAILFGNVHELPILKARLLEILDLVDEVHVAEGDRDFRKQFARIMLNLFEVLNIPTYISCSF